MYSEKLLRDIPINDCVAAKRLLEFRNKNKLDGDLKVLHVTFDFDQFGLEPSITNKNLFCFRLVPRHVKGNTGLGLGRDGFAISIFYGDLRIDHLTSQHVRAKSWYVALQLLIAGDGNCSGDCKNNDCNLKLVLKNHISKLIKRISVN
ncbi:hypothetical protein C4572_01385 [Candidatus Parcubacteria bacterium]|nr:MAG: hypothetical protein C4572_01385 [Candidatus Parcubacteria bacterium]